MALVPSLDLLPSVALFIPHAVNGADSQGKAGSGCPNFGGGPRMA